jgi:tellurite methyltransferase
MSLSDRERWNARYRDRGPAAFGDAPSDWLRQHEMLLREQRRGRALVIACGNGRNACYLASLGFEVDALDISEVAIGWLKEQVTASGLPVHPRMADLTRDPLPEGHYQVILNFNYLERGLFPALAGALAPGGLLFFETFIRDQIELFESRILPRYTLDHNELLRAFSHLRILHYREGVFWEAAREKKRAVASLVAKAE